MTDQKRTRGDSNDRLLFLKVPINCDSDFLRQWVESRGYKVSSVKIVRDLVSGTSPSFAHVQLMDSAKLDEAERTLDGDQMRGKAIRVRRVARSQDNFDINSENAA